MSRLTAPDKIGPSLGDFQIEMMRKDILLALALGSCLGAAAAFAQDNLPPVAAPAATPDASSTPAAGDDAIHLHMPVHHRAVHHASPKPAENAAPAETPTIDTIGADTSPAPAAPVVSPSAETPAPAQSATAAKSAPAGKSAPAIPFSFGEDSGAAPPEASAPAGNRERKAAVSTHETRTASLPPKAEIFKETPVPPKPVKQAFRAKVDEHAGLAKRGAVLFDKGKSSPSPQQFGGLKLLAGELSTALESGRGPVQLEAYAGTRGDKSSGAHRLSLERAIAVRQLLIDNGLPSNRIIVRAMGGADDSGPNDRVDVFVRAS